MPLQCPSPHCSSHTASPSSSITQLLIETQWMQGVALQCPHCQQYLLPCECCSRFLTPHRTHRSSSSSVTANAGGVNESASTTTASSAAVPTSTPVQYSLGRCDSCHFVTPLPSSTIASPCPRSLLSLAPLFAWSPSRVWHLQFQIDSAGYLRFRTQKYLEKLEEFKLITKQNIKHSGGTSASSSVSESGGGSGSSGRERRHSNQPQVHQHRRELGGAQIEESKSQDSIMNELAPCATPPSPRSRSTHLNQQQQRAHPSPSRIEQQLLHAREQLLQCQEMLERHEASEDILSELEGELSERRREFNQTHMKVMQMLCSSSAASASIAAASSISPAAASSSPLLPSSFHTLTTQFLHDRTLLQAQKARLEDSWRLLKHVAGMDVGGTASSADASSSAATSAAAVSSTNDLATTTMRVMKNLFECRFQREELLFKLRCEQYHNLLRDISQLLFHLYDAYLFTTLRQPLPVPTSLTSHVAAPDDATSTEQERIAWKDMISHVHTLQQARITPPDYMKLKQTSPLAIEDRMLHDQTKNMSADDMQLCIEYARLLYADVYQTIALPLRDVATLTQAVKLQQKSAAPVDIADETNADIDMTPASSADPPLLAQATPPSPIVPLHATSSSTLPYARSAPLHPQQQAANSARKKNKMQQQSTAGASHFIQAPTKRDSGASAKRHHPYQRV